MSFVLNVSANTLVSYLVHVFQQHNENKEPHFEATLPYK